MERAHGIDISQHNKSFSFDRAKKNGAVIQFIILRASLAVRSDTQFINNLKASAPIPIVGAYHYFTYSTPWKEQADYFLKVVQGEALHIFALDFEKQFNAPKAQADYIKKNAEGARQWLEYVSKSTEKNILFYTNPSTYNELTRLGHSWMARWPLWIANYDVQTPNLPQGVSDWKFWQYSADRNNQGSNYGVGSTHVDLIYYNGTVDDLHQWAKPHAERKSSELGKARKTKYSWRDVLNATKQADEKLYGKWLKEAGILDKVINDKTLLSKPYTGPPIDEWQINLDKRLEILKRLGATSSHEESGQGTYTWRDVIIATKQADPVLFGKWLREAGILDKVKNDRTLLGKPYSGPSITTWQIKSEKRLDILKLLEITNVKVSGIVGSRQSQSIKLNVPYLSQQDSREANLHDADCGPTCLAMLLRAEGVNGDHPAKQITVNELYKRYLPDVLAAKNRKANLNLFRLKDIGGKEGLEPHFNQYREKNEALTGLREMISKGQPFIALINYAKWSDTVRPILGFSFTGRHYVVVTGFDDGHVYVHDPLFPVAQIAKGTFYKWPNDVFLAGWGTVDKPIKPNQNFVHFWTNKIVSRL
jgi:lysozyme